MARIGDVDETFIREYLANVVQDGKSAHTRVEDADGSRMIHLNLFHRLIAQELFVRTVVVIHALGRDLDDARGQ
jgi:hypothetical protein